MTRQDIEKLIDHIEEMEYSNRYESYYVSGYNSCKSDLVDYLNGIKGNFSNDIKVDEFEQVEQIRKQMVKVYDELYETKKENVNLCNKFNAKQQQATINAISVGIDNIYTYLDQSLAPHELAEKIREELSDIMDSIGEL